MANKDLTLEKNTEKSVEGFINRNRKVLLSIIGLIVVAAVAVSVYFIVSSNATKKALDDISTIEYTYLKNATDLSDEDVSARQSAAMTSLDPYLAKKNVAGVRANMLAADIAFSKEDYTSAAGYYLKAAEAGKKSYTAPVCYYNAAVTSEELGNNEDAVKYYEMAVGYGEFLLKSHTLFSLGRVYEEMGNYEEAGKFYQKLVNEYTDSWTNLANSRLIALRSQGKIL